MTPATARSTDTPRVGMLATVRNRCGVVAGVEPYDAGPSGALNFVQLEYLDDHLPEEERLLWEREPGDHRELLEPHALPDPTRPPMAPSGFDALLRAARWTALSPYLDPDEAGGAADDERPPASPLHGGVRVEDYQLAPLRKALRMPRVNLLIADDVGLGKTVEAGLILTELLLRRRIRRVLILTPASLRNQWREEMWEKFALRFEVVDRRATTLHRRTLGMDANPWRSFDRIVASYHYLRQPDILEQFRSASHTPEGSPRLPWDLLIVDECHHLMPAPFGPDSDLSGAVASLTPLFEHRLFLSATPHNGHTASFTGLLEMLDPVRFHRTSEMGDAMRRRTREVVVRRLKRDLARADAEPRFSEREPPRSLSLPNGPAETALSEAFGAFRRRLRELTGDGGGPRRRAGAFAVEVLGKRLLSCPTAFAESWRRSKQGFEGDETAGEAELGAAERALRRESGDDGEAQQREAAAASVTGSWLRNFAESMSGEIAALDAALAGLGFDLGPDADAIVEQDPSADTRLDALTALIEERLRTDGRFRDDERLIVFTEYKTTLDYLARRLTKRYGPDRILTLFGAGGKEGMTDTHRELVKDAFNDEGESVRVLVATDAASEGLNLHRTARYLLHYDCPWNPSRLEQRNGRLDRYGQARPVATFHFLKDADADLGFLARLVKKADEIRGDLGSVNELFDTAAHRRLVQGEDAQSVARALDRGVADARKRASFDADDARIAVETRPAAAGPKELAAALDLDPITLAATLETAMRTNGPGPHLQPVGDASVYRLRQPDLPGWREVIDREVRLSADGNGTGAMPQLAFSSEPFMESRGPLRVFRPRREMQLAHLAHPLVRRALTVLARARYPGTAEAARWTVRRSPGLEEAAPGADAVVLVGIEEFAVNDLRETFHRWVRPLAYPVLGGELGEPLPPEAVRALAAAPGTDDREASGERAGEVLEEVHRALKARLRDHGRRLSEAVRERLAADLETATERENNRYRSRLGELASHIQSRTEARLEREIAALRNERSQGRLFDPDFRLAALDRSEEEKRRELERIRQRAHGLVERLRKEQSRVLSLLPRRYRLNGEVHIFPVTVEVRFPDRTG